MNEEVEITNRPVDTNTELAKERTRDAYDRTLMAWIRTALALIGFGFGIFEFAGKSTGDSIFRSSKLVGLLFILLGNASIYLAIRENRLSYKRLLNPVIRYDTKATLGIKVGYALIVIGIIAFYFVISNIIRIGL